MCIYWDQIGWHLWRQVIEGWRWICVQTKTPSCGAQPAPEVVSSWGVVHVSSPRKGGGGKGACWCSSWMVGYKIIIWRIGHEMARKPRMQWISEYLQNQQINMCYLLQLCVRCPYMHIMMKFLKLHAQRNMMANNNNTWCMKHQKQFQNKLLEYMWTPKTNHKTVHDKGGILMHNRPRQE